MLAEMDDAWSGKCSRGSEQRAIEARPHVCAAFVPGTTAEAGRASRVCCCPCRCEEPSFLAADRPSATRQTGQVCDPFAHWSAPLVLASAGGARCRKAGSWQGTSWASARASASG